MTEITWTSTIIACIIFIGLASAGVFLVTIVDPNDMVANNTNTQLGNASTQLSGLNGQSDVNDQNAKPSASDQALTNVGATGSVLTGFKSYKNIAFTIQSLAKNVLSFVPSFVWWTFGSILVITLISLSVRAWLRIDP